MQNAQTTPTTTQQVVIRYNAYGTCYDYVFPLSELGNFIALVGWTVTNYLDKTPEVRAELNRIEELSDAQDGIDIPNGREWYAKYATEAKGEYFPAHVVEAKITNLRTAYQQHSPELVGTVRNGLRSVIVDFGSGLIGVNSRPATEQVGDTYTYPGTAAHQRETATILAFL